MPRALLKGYLLSVAIGALSLLGPPLSDILFGLFDWLQWTITRRSLHTAFGLPLVSPWGVGSAAFYGVLFPIAVTIWFHHVQRRRGDPRIHSRVALAARALGLSLAVWVLSHAGPKLTSYLFLGTAEVDPSDPRPEIGFYALILPICLMIALSLAFRRRPHERLNFDSLLPL